MHYSRHQIKKNGMGWACGENGGGKRCIQGFGEKNLTNREHWKVLGIDRLIILKWIFNQPDGGMY
jgi:hypothetical protein